MIGPVFVNIGLKPLFSDQPTIDIVQFIDVGTERAFTDNFVVKFIPSGQRCKLGARKWSQRAEIKTVG
jgi:hypothetical protein